MEGTPPLALLRSWRAGGQEGGRGRNIFLCPPQELGAGGLGVEGLPPLALLRSSRTGVGRNTSHSPSRELELEMEGWGRGEGIPPLTLLRSWRAGMEGSPPLALFRSWRAGVEGTPPLALLLSWRAWAGLTHMAPPHPLMSWSM